MSTVTRERWSWLTYALCCGGSESTIPNVEIARDTLTKAELVAIEAVLKTNYPLPVPETGLETVAQYGFVDIREGTHLYLGEFSDSNETLLVNSCASRYRARYNPGSTDAVEIIVPGYGVCKGRLGDDIQFTRDCGTTNLQQKRLSGSLELRYLHMENAALLMDLLTLITRGLRQLLIIGEETSIIHVDLTALSAACPDLQELYAGYYSTVEISASDEALRSWPIKFMTIHHNFCLSELSLCLKDPSIRMARELEKLEVRKPRYLPFSNENGKILEAHDGEFLPVTKEKLPFQEKIAMISAVTSSGIGLKALHLLDAHVLSLIFVFASTPAQREVKVHD